MNESSLSDMLTVLQVSWLPPQHPRAKITVSAEKLQSNLSNVSAGKTDGGGGLKTLDRRKPVSVSIREPPSKKKKAERMEELDPMDPASYSEVCYSNRLSNYDNVSVLNISTKENTILCNMKFTILLYKVVSSKTWRDFSCIFMSLDFLALKYSLQQTKFP